MSTGQIRRPTTTRAISVGSPPSAAPRASCSSVSSMASNAVPQHAHSVLRRDVTGSGEVAMKTKLGSLMLGVGLLFLVGPVAAHHSWTVDYDSGKPITVKGVVTKVEWTNPH